MRKTITLLLFILCLSNLAVVAQTSEKWLPLREKEYLKYHGMEELDMDTKLDYDAKGRVVLRYGKTYGCEDSIRYSYNEWDQNIYEADYRGMDGVPLFLYTYDNREYDPILHDLCVLRIGYQYVDQEWSIYKAEKIKIDRDANNQILRIGDYTPGDETTPDIPISYVKNFTYKDGKVDSYTYETYNMDPVTEEAYLKLEEKWTNIVWESYEGQVLDPNQCYHGANRIKSAHVYEDYAGYEYDLNVVYGGEHPDNYVATMEIASANLRKIHSLTFTDNNGSFVEEFRTFRIEDGTPVLTFIERATENYDDHGNLVQKERALTADTRNPETVSVREGNMYRYTYNSTYNDWTSCDQFKFRQSYEPGSDGEYEQYGYVERLDWVPLSTLGIHNVKAEKGRTYGLYDLQGRPVSSKANGVVLNKGQKQIIR